MMTDSIQLISEADAVGLIGAIPDVVDVAGIKRRALAFESPRDGSQDGWRCAFPREGTIRVGEQDAKIGLAPISFRPSQLVGAQIEMAHPDGRVFRASPLLVQALLGWLYVAIERGDIVIPQETP